MATLQRTYIPQQQQQLKTIPLAANSLESALEQIFHLGSSCGSLTFAKLVHHSSNRNLHFSCSHSFVNFANRRETIILYFGPSFSGEFHFAR